MKDKNTEQFPKDLGIFSNWIWPCLPLMPEWAELKLLPLRISILLWKVNLSKFVLITPIKKENMYPIKPGSDIKRESFLIIFIYQAVTEKLSEKPIILINYLKMPRNF